MNGLKKRIIGTSLMAAVLVGMLGAAPAEAFTASPSGCVGALQAGMAAGSFGLGGYDLVYSPGFDSIKRTGCYAGAQTVTVTMRQFGYATSNGWTLRHTNTLSAVTLQPGQYARVQPQVFYASAWNVTIDVTIVWRTAQGAFLGQLYLDYNAVRDYYCPSGPCVVSPDPTVGAYIHWNY